jgi:hypothetical protein
VLFRTLKDAFPEAKEQKQNNETSKGLQHGVFLQSVCIVEQVSNEVK